MRVSVLIKQGSTMQVEVLIRPLSALVAEIALIALGLGCITLRFDFITLTFAVVTVLTGASSGHMGCWCKLAKEMLVHSLSWVSFQKSFRKKVIPERECMRQWHWHGTLRHGYSAATVTTCVFVPNMQSALCVLSASLPHVPHVRMQEYTHASTQHTRIDALAERIW